MTLHERNRYRGVLAGAVILGTVGAVGTSDWLIALAAVPLVFVAIEELATPPTPELGVERHCSTTRPEPGERVTVSLTVRNDGDSPLPDVRVADGVPAGLEIVDGTERTATALAPGASETVEYVVSATTGTHEFEPPTIRVRSVIGGAIRDLQPAVAGADTLAAERFLGSVPTDQETATMVGVVPTGKSGSGVEFHTTREYRPGDPINRIDWRRLARSGTLSTVNYREHEGVSVTVIADCRHAAQTPGGSGCALPPALRQALFDRCRYAADRCVNALEASGHDVGFAALGPDSVPWIEPGSTDVAARSRAALNSFGGDGSWEGPTLLLEDADTLGRAGVDGPNGADSGERPTAVPDGGASAKVDERDTKDGENGATIADGRTSSVVEGDAASTDDGSDLPGSDGDDAPPEPTSLELLTDRLADRQPPGGIVLLVSPLLDGVPATVAGRLDARGHPVTVVSPAIGASEDYEAQIDALARRTRIDRLHDAGIRVIDWSDAEPLPVAVARAEVRQ